MLHFVAGRLCVLNYLIFHFIVYIENPLIPRQCTHSTSLAFPIISSWRRKKNWNWSIFPEVKNEFFRKAKSDALNSGGFVVDCVISQKARRKCSRDRGESQAVRAEILYFYCARNCWWVAERFASSQKTLLKWQSIHESLQFLLARERFPHSARCFSLPKNVFARYEKY